MDQDVVNKRQELFRVLAQIENRITSLDSKGLSAVIFDFGKVNDTLDQMRDDCTKDSTKRNYLS